LQQVYAKIEKPVYTVDNQGECLKFNLIYSDGFTTNWQLNNPKDIKTIIEKTKAFKVSKLEGKIVEGFKDGNLLKGLSVNENLV